MLRKWTTTAFLLVTFFLVGCTALQPFPQQARQGDTITIAVGSPDGMNKQNTTVVYTPDGGTAVDLTPGIRAIIKLSPDPLSEGVLFDTGTISALSSSSAHGPWQGVIVLDLPDLLEGTGLIEVSSTADYGIVQNGVNGIQIPFTVLPGTGAPNSFDHLAGILGTRPGDLSLLEPASQIVIRPPIPYVEWDDSTQYGAIEVKVTAPLRTADYNVLPDSDVRVVHDDMGSWDQAAQTMTSWKREGDVITIYMISPVGKLFFFQARFAIAVKAGSVIDSTPVTSVESVRYFDINGVEISGPSLAASIELSS